MDWRGWAYNALTFSTDITDTIPVDRIYGSGAVEVVPNTKPFMVIRMETQVPELNDGDEPEITSMNMSLWVHDEPGSYVTIDAVLAAARAILVGTVPSALACMWQGDTGDLADDTYKTITRSSSYRLIGGVS